MFDLEKAPHSEGTGEFMSNMKGRMKMNKFARAATLALAAAAMALPVQGSVAAMRMSAVQASEPVSADGSPIDTPASETRRYCANGIVLTGSRIAKRLCMTKAEWADQGIDITEKK